MRLKLFILAIWCCLVCVQNVTAAGTIRRFALVAGANFGGPDRVPLRYAVSDAEHFTQVLEMMGGVAGEDRLLLREPDLAAFQKALAALKEKVVGAGGAAGRTEVLVYYSGHADENGLLLGANQLSYRYLRDMMDAIRADVHITVLDACASGAITRLKGGQRQKAFMVDASSDMKGYAFLTSSSEDEAAQESDRIGASFFTHYLVSGMRGAADVSGDGKVTLGEAYQFAFQETLSHTTRTQGGAQHPAYDIKMTGTGDVVMTDVRQTSASLILGEHLNGRLFVRNAREQVVAELYKAGGRAVELGLEPGVYEIQFEQQKALLESRVELTAGQRLRVYQRDFESALREETTSRGGPIPERKPRKQSRPKYKHLLDGKYRVERSIGQWDPGKDSKAWTFAYWLQEHIALNLTFSGFSFKAAENDSVKTGVSARLLGVRLYLPVHLIRLQFRPYMEGSVGRFTGKEPGVNTQVYGTHLGGGLDIPLTGGIMVGGHAGYNRMEAFETPVDSRTDYSGMDYSVGISLIFF